MENPNAARPTVLCIDDSLLIRKTIAMTVGSSVELLSTGSAREGLTMAEQSQPRLIITDIHMPGMDGFEMLAALKANPKTAHIPVVALTSASSLADRERGRLAGFIDYVPKTTDFSALMRLVAMHCRNAVSAPNKDTPGTTAQAGECLPEKRPLTSTVQPT